MQIKRWSAQTVYLLMEGLTGFFYSTVWTLATLYRVETAGLNPLQLVLVGTCLETTAFLFEIPTGIVADLYSRRLSVIISYCLIGLGFIIEGSLPWFSAILLSQALWGIGWTFTSGADAAWITDEVGEERATTVFLRAAQINQLGALLGIGASVWLGGRGLGLPIICGGGAFIALGLLLCHVMPETGFQPTPRADRNSWQAMLHTLRAGVKAIASRPALSLLLLVGLCYGLSTEGIDRLWQVRLLQLQLPTTPNWSIAGWVGAISASSTLLSVAVTQLLTKRCNLRNVSHIGTLLIAINAGFVIGMAAFALAGNFHLAVACYLSMQLLRRTNGPLRKAWLNRHLTASQVRATVLSMQSQVDALGQMIGGPLIGLVATLYAASAGILAGALLLAPIPFLYWLATRHGRLDGERTMAATG